MSTHDALMDGLAQLNALLDRPAEGDDWLKALQDKNAALEGAVGDQIRALTERLERSETDRKQADAQIREAIAGIMTAIGKVVEESRSINARALTVLEGSGKAEDPALAREVATLKSAVQLLQEKLEAQPHQGGRDAIEGQVDPVEEDAARAIERSVLTAIGEKMAPPSTNGSGPRLIPRRLRRPSPKSALISSALETEEPDLWDLRFVSKPETSTPRTRLNLPWAWVWGSGLAFWFVMEVLSAFADRIASLIVGVLF